MVTPHEQLRAMTLSSARVFERRIDASRLIYWGECLRIRHVATMSFNGALFFSSAIVIDKLNNMDVEMWRSIAALHQRNCEDVPDAVWLFRAYGI